jgi:branched-subunit amino acid transport protein
MLLPSAAVFLLLLCNDKAVLGPWVNGRGLNFFTGAVIAVLVMLSIILTASVLFPEIDSETILAILVAGRATALVIYLITPGEASAEPADPSLRDTWRMPPLANLPLRHLTTLNRTWRLVLRAYLIVAAGLVLARIVTLATIGD